MKKMVLIAALMMSSSMHAMAADLQTLEPAVPLERGTLPTYTVVQLSKTDQGIALRTVTPAQRITKADEPWLPTIKDAERR